MSRVLELEPPMSRVPALLPVLRVDALSRVPMLLPLMSR